MSQSLKKETLSCVSKLVMLMWWSTVEASAEKHPPLRFFRESPRAAPRA